MAESANFPQIYSTEIGMPEGDPPASSVTVVMLTQTTLGPRYHTYVLDPQTFDTMQAAMTRAYDDTVDALTAAGFTPKSEVVDVDRNGFVNDDDLPAAPDP